jgi:catalase
MTDRLGTNGPLLLQGVNLVSWNTLSSHVTHILIRCLQIEHLSHFVRERVVSYSLVQTDSSPTNRPLKPERTVHAKGAGAHGYFEVTTTNGAKYSMADVFSEVGKRTPLTGRLSTIAGNLGNPDAVRDLRGLAFK